MRVLIHGPLRGVRGREGSPEQGEDMTSRGREFPGHDITREGGVFEARDITREGREDGADILFHTE